MTDSEAREFLVNFLNENQIIPKRDTPFDSVVVCAHAHHGNTVIGAFEIRKNLTSLKEWREVFWWGVDNGYYFRKGQAPEENHPVSNISLYDCIAWCNAKSEMESLLPCYILKGEVVRSSSELKAKEPSDVICFKHDHNGHRLPTFDEWVRAAYGCRDQSNFAFSGSDDIDAVAVWSGNADGGTAPVGSKSPNEIGIYDMTGNLQEWVWDDCKMRHCLGGSWASDASECSLKVYTEYHISPYLLNDEIGFRTCRSRDFFEKNYSFINSLSSKDVDEIIKAIS